MLDGSPTFQCRDNVECMDVMISPHSAINASIFIQISADDLPQSNGSVNLHASCSRDSISSTAADIYHIAKRRADTDTIFLAYH